ncbi:MAG: acyltransferase [Luteolibacter sp.]|uniref:acyltransferase family protein n=1 Tax=Luteolibacter sp. TaxID=1962973 RepID=UPI003263653A
MTALDITRHPSPGESRRHLPGLDGIRGLAILLVMLSHFIVVGNNLGTNTPTSRFLHSGYLGVDLFFVLSGFLITGILIDSKTSPAYFRVFYLRRALRIFPLYYGLLAVSSLTVIFITPEDRPLLTGNDSMAWYWLYASNIGMAVKGDWLASPTWVGLGHFWSLAVEEQFYLVWPLLVYLTPVKYLKRLCVVLVVASPFVYMVLPYLFGGGDPKYPEAFAAGNRATYVSTLGRLGVLAAGGWLAIIWRMPGAWPKFNHLLIPCAVVSGALLLLERTFLADGSFLDLSFMEPSLALVLGTACVGLAAGGASGPLRSDIFATPVLRWLGKYSYGIYVYHHALKPVWQYFLWDGWITRVFGTGWPATLCYTASATTASLILAWLSWTCFEGPILSLKSRFSYGSRKAPESDATPSSLS